VRHGHATAWYVFSVGTGKGGCTLFAPLRKGDCPLCHAGKGDSPRFQTAGNGCSPLFLATLNTYVFANEKVRAPEPLANPDVTECEQAGEFCVLALEALVRIKLTAFRDKDRTHLRDLIEVGLVGADWLPRLPAVLAERLRLLLETPEG